MHEQEFVIAGWSEPRASRTHFGALILGVYEHGELRYAGHVGTGFDSKELDKVMRLLKPLAKVPPNGQFLGHQLWGTDEWTPGVTRDLGCATSEVDVKVDVRNKKKK